MRRDEAVTVWCRASPALSRQWYGDLARLLAAAPSPAAALLEGSFGHDRVTVTVRPRGIVDALRRSPAGVSVRLEERRPRAPTPPAELACERSGLVMRRWAPPHRPANLEPATVDRVGIRGALDSEAWLGLQTFWLPTGGGTLWLARRFRLAARSKVEIHRCLPVIGTAIAAEWSTRVGLPATFRVGTMGHRRDWRVGGVRTIPAEGWFDRPPDNAARSVLSHETADGASGERPVERPAIVLGASGAGKTTYLARGAAHRTNRGESVVVIDLHGDLAPAILDRLTPDARRRIIAIDATCPPVPGIAALASNEPSDTAAAHLVAALKRISPDGTDLYWGFRLERIFDTFVRLALESGGSLTDVYDLLTNPERRDAARLATRTPGLAKFLEELTPIVRRNPDFLWSAATRLSKVMLVPALRELLVPEDGGLPVEPLLEGGRTMLVRLPFASLGPEAAAFAATLILGRVYLGVAAAAERAARPIPVSVVLDEVHAFSPRLVAEILTEGRKFGIRTIVATQYPERMARELQSAARGALRGFVTFRVPRASAVEVGGWMGLGPAEAAEILPNLPTGQGLIRDTVSDGVRPTLPEERHPVHDAQAWNASLDATRREFAVTEQPTIEGQDGDAATERLLLAVLATTESGGTVRREEVVARAVALPGACPDPALLSDRLPVLLREGYLDEDGVGLRLTAAGERRLGLTTPTGAIRETAEHRALLMAAFRLFARRGYRIEVLRQGRFDTTLPDARFRQLSDRSEMLVPVTLATEIDRARRGWAWRFFGGRDVFLEAEVSGALRSERVRHGVRKALHRGAFVLFVVGDARRAHRVRSVVRAMGLGADRAQVWTLRIATGSFERPRTPNP